MSSSHQVMSSQDMSQSQCCQLAESSAVLFKSDPKNGKRPDKSNAKIMNIYIKILKRSIVANVVSCWVWVYFPPKRYNKFMFLRILFTCVDRNYLLQICCECTSPAALFCIRDGVLRPNGHFCISSCRWGGGGGI